MGNRRSVEKALEHVGAQAPITADLEVLESCAGLIIPGVGAFPRGMERLRALGLPEYIRGRAADGTPGLGLLPGEVKWLSPDGLRLPHIGWNDVRFERRTALIEGLPAEGCPFYHV